MKLTTFKVGDLVRLKSGGPTMTVADVDLSIGTKCQWFGGKKLEHGYFSTESLLPYSDVEDAKSKSK